MDEFDCTRCGACCCNSEENRQEGYLDYVEVKRGEALLAVPHLFRKHVIENERGEYHLRLDSEGRCLALRGPLMKRVSCTIYPYRPTPCRRVQPGDANCLRARAGKSGRHGINV